MSKETCLNSSLTAQKQLVAFYALLKH